jgi:hypothetical protein
MSDREKQEVTGSVGRQRQLPPVQKAIIKAHVLRASSSAIQDALVDEAERMGFVSERRGLFACQLRRLRSVLGGGKISYDLHGM